MSDGHWLHQADPAMCVCGESWPHEEEAADQDPAESVADYIVRTAAIAEDGSADAQSVSYSVEGPEFGPS